MMRTGRPKEPVVLSEEERERLESLSHRARSQPALARRARVVLACSEGLDNKSVARKLRCSLGMVGKWRSRFLRHEWKDSMMSRDRVPRARSLTSMLSRSSFRHWRLRHVDRRTGARVNWLKPPASAA